MITFWAYVVGSVTFLITTIVVFAILSGLKQEKKDRMKPRIGVCINGNTVGLVLMSDLQKAADDLWKPYEEGEEVYDHGGGGARSGHRVSVEPTFTFRRFMGFPYGLIGSCFAQVADFEVREIWTKSSATDEEVVKAYEAAYRHFHKKTPPNWTAEEWRRW